MKELEITVKVNSSYDKLRSDLERIGFKKIKQTIMYDTYMIDKNIDISNMKDLDILSKCIIVRNIDDYNAFIYKIKEYDEYENIVSQEKIECNISNVNSGIKFMKMINYKELLNIKSELIIYSNNIFEIAVQIADMREFSFSWNCSWAKSRTLRILRADTSPPSRMMTTSRKDTRPFRSLGGWVLPVSYTSRSQGSISL